MAQAIAPGTLPGDDIALKCIEDLIVKIGNIPQFDKRTFFVFQEEDIVDATKMLNKPCVGLLYTGITQREDGTNKGMSGELTVTLVVIGESRTQARIIDTNERPKMLQWLGQLRRMVRLTTSPSGHPWRFRAEFPAGELGGFDSYLQRWSTPVILTNPPTIPNQHFAPPSKQPRELL